MSPLRKAPERDKKVDKLLQMSTRELNRLEIMQKLEEKRMRQKEAARILGVSVRQVKRLLKSYRRSSASLIHSSILLVEGHTGVPREG